MIHGPSTAFLLDESSSFDPPRTSGFPSYNHSSIALPNYSYQQQQQQNLLVAERDQRRSQDKVQNNNYSYLHERNEYQQKYNTAMNHSMQYLSNQDKRIYREDDYIDTSKPNSLANLNQLNKSQQSLRNQQILQDQLSRDQSYKTQSTIENDVKQENEKKKKHKKQQREQTNLNQSDMNHDLMRQQEGLSNYFSLPNQQKYQNEEPKSSHRFNRNKSQLDNLPRSHQHFTNKDQQQERSFISKNDLSYQVQQSKRNHQRSQEPSYRENYPTGAQNNFNGLPSQITGGSFDFNKSSHLSRQQQQQLRPERSYRQVSNRFDTQNNLIPESDRDKRYLLEAKSPEFRVKELQRLDLGSYPINNQERLDYQNQRDYSNTRDGLVSNHQKNMPSFNPSTPGQINVNPFSGYKQQIQEQSSYRPVTYQEQSVSVMNGDGISFLNLLDRTSTHEDYKTYSNLKQSNQKIGLTYQSSAAHNGYQNQVSQSFNIQQPFYTNQYLAPTFTHQNQQREVQYSNQLNSLNHATPAVNKQNNINTILSGQNHLESAKEFSVNTPNNNSSLFNYQSQFNTYSQQPQTQFNQPQQVGQPQNNISSIMHQTANTAIPLSPSPDIMLSIDETSNANSNQILKLELYQTKKQLIDAQNSYDFMKKEKLRIEHEKNLLDIQLKQMDDIHQNHANDQNNLLQRIKDLETNLKEEQVKKDKMVREIKSRDHQYKDKLIKINSDLEQIDKRKHKNKEKLYQIFMQMKASAQSISQISENEFQTHPLRDFLASISEKCELMEHLVISHLHPKRDQTLKVKAFKRQHNFEKFRKETTGLIHKYFNQINETYATQQELVQKDLEIEKQQNLELRQRLQDDKVQNNNLQEKLRTLQQQLNHVIEKFSRQKDHMMNLNENEVKVLQQENDILKKRERQQEEELKYLRDQVRRLTHDKSQLKQIVQNNSSNKRGKSLQNTTSTQNTQQIIFNNREFMRVVEDKNILERQVDEYKSTLFNQSQLIRSLQNIIQKQQLKSGGEKLQREFDETIRDSIRQTMYITTDDGKEERQTLEPIEFNHNQQSHVHHNNPIQSNNHHHHQQNKSANYQSQQPLNHAIIQNKHTNHLSVSGIGAKLLQNSQNHNNQNIQYDENENISPNNLNQIHYPHQKQTSFQHFNNNSGMNSIRQVNLKQFNNKQQQQQNVSQDQFNYKSKYARNKGMDNSSHIVSSSIEDAHNSTADAINSQKSRKSLSRQQYQRDQSHNKSTIDNDQDTINQEMKRRYSNERSENNAQMSGDNQHHSNSYYMREVNEVRCDSNHKIIQEINKIQDEIQDIQRSLEL
eukprot:403349805